MTKQWTCPEDGSTAKRMIYMGLPGWLCTEHDAIHGDVHVGGLGGWVAMNFPMPTYDVSGHPKFAFVTYGDEGYFVALFRWLRGLY